MTIPYFDLDPEDDADTTATAQKPIPHFDLEPDDNTGAEEAPAEKPKKLDDLGVGSAVKDTFKGMAEAVVYGLKNPEKVIEATGKGVQGFGHFASEAVHHPIDTGKALIVDALLRPLVIDPLEVALDAKMFTGEKLSQQERYDRTKEATANWTGLVVGGLVGRAMAIGGKVATIERAASVKSIPELVTKLATMDAGDLLKVADLATDPTKLRALAKGAVEGTTAGGVIGLGTGDTPEERLNNAFNYGVAGAVLGSAGELRSRLKEVKIVKGIREGALDLAATKQAEKIMSLPPENALKAAVQYHQGIPLDQVMLRNTPEGSTVILHDLPEVSAEVRSAGNAIVHVAEDGTHRVLIDGPLTEVASDVHPEAHLPEGSVERRLATAERLAYQDAQTGFQNRNAWEEAKPSIEADPNVVVGLADIVNLGKGANNTLGQAAGDVLIKESAAALKKAIGSSKVRVFRVGGDEFAVVGKPTEVARILKDAEAHLGVRKVKGTDIPVAIRTASGNSYNLASEALIPEKSRIFDTSKSAEFTGELPADIPKAKYAERFTPEQRESFRATGFMENQVVVHGGKEYAFQGVEGGKVRATDLSNGRTRLLDKSKVAYAPKFEFATLVEVKDPASSATIAEPPVTSSTSYASSGDAFDRKTKIEAAARQLEMDFERGAAEVPPEVQPDGPISEMARKEGGKLGAGLDKNAFHSLGANLYANNLASTVAKEGLQNAIDAVRPTGGQVKVWMDLHNPRRYGFIDEGTGMTPEIIENEFLDIGGTDKPDGASGGLGLAKVALFYYAKDIHLVSVTDTPNGRIRSELAFNGEQWINGDIPAIKTTKVGPEVKTGTDLKFEVKPDAKWDEYQFQSFIENASRRSPEFQIVHDLHHSPRNPEWKVDEPEAPGELLHQEHNAAYDLVAHASKDTKVYGDYDKLQVHLLNRGYYQSTVGIQFKGEGPRNLTVNIDSKVPTAHPDYPYTASREALKGPVMAGLEAVVKNLSEIQAKKQSRQIAEGFVKAPVIRGTSGRVIDTSLSLDPKLLKQLADRPYAKKLHDIVAKGFELIATEMELKIGQIDPGGHGNPADVGDFFFGGIGVGKTYLGVNINMHGLEKYAVHGGLDPRLLREVNMDPGNPMGQIAVHTQKRAILVNPYTSWYEIQLGVNNGKIRQEYAHEALAEHMIGTIVHELTHQLEGGHSEGFAGALTRALGATRKVAGRAEPALVKFFGEYQNAIGHDYGLLSDQWSDKNAFRSLSSHEHQERIGGDAISSPESRGEVRRGEGNIERSSETRSEPGDDVRGREKGSGEPINATPSIRADDASVRPVGSLAEPKFSLPDKYSRMRGMYNGHKVKFGSDFDKAMYFHDLKDAIIRETGISPDQYDAHRATMMEGLRVARKAATTSGEEIFLPPTPFDKMAKIVAKATGKKPKPVFTRTGVDVLQKSLEAETNAMVQLLHPEEQALFHENRAALEALQAESAQSLATLASQNGYLIQDVGNGAVEITDRSSNKSYGKFTTRDSAMEFVKKGGMSVGDIFFDIDGPRGGGIIPPDGLGDVGKSAFDDVGPKFLERLRATVITQAGGFFPRADLFKAIETLDPSVRLHSDVYMKVSPALMKMNAIRHPWMVRLKEIQESLFKGMSKERRELLYDYIGTASPEERMSQVPGKGYSKSQPMTQAEMHLGQLMAQDLKNAGHDGRAFDRAFAYRRVRLELSDNLKPDEVAAKMKEYEAKLVKSGEPPLSPQEKNLVTRLDEAAKEPLQRMRLGAVTSLARSVLDGEMSKADFAKHHKMTPVELAAAGQIEKFFSDLAPHLDIEPVRLLNNYISHIRNADLGDFKRSDLYKEMGPLDKEFFASLARTGELTKVLKDPIEIATRYLTAGMKAKYLNAAIDEARINVDKAAASIGDHTRVGIKAAQQIKELGDRYINQALGEIEGHDALVLRAVDKLIGRVAKTATPSERSSFTNAWLRASEFAAQGFKPMAGARDIGSFVQIFNTRLGTKRFANGLRIWAQSDSPAARLKQLGETPGLSMIYTMTSEQQLARDVTEGFAGAKGRASRVLRAAEEAGFKYSFQPTVYENAHAFVYGEVFHTVGNNLNKLVKGTISRNEFERAIDLDTYETSIRREFNRQLDNKKYLEATQYIAKVTGQEIVGYYGMANHPYMFSGKYGRLLGQFGQWPMWAISGITRMASQGRGSTKALTAARFGVALGATSVVGAMTGVNLTNWSIDPRNNMWSGGPAVQLSWTMLNAIGTKATPTRDYARRNLEMMWKAFPKNINLPIPFQIYDSAEGVQRLMHGDPPWIAGWKFLGGQVDTKEYPKP